MSQHIVQRESDIMAGNGGKDVLEPPPPATPPTRSDLDLVQPPGDGLASHEPAEIAGVPTLKDCAIPSADDVAMANDRPHLWLRRGDQLFVGVLAAAVIALMFGHWLRLSGWDREPVEISRLPASSYEFRLNVNAATWVEWAQLDGIGDTLAHRIVEDREQNGSFTRVDDLLRVKGIGPKTLERIRPWLEIGSPP